MAHPMPTPELLTETIHVGPYLVELDESSVEISKDDESDEDFVDAVKMAPTTRREANQLSMALRKASKRMEEIAHTLPAE